MRNCLLAGVLVAAGYRFLVGDHVSMMVALGIATTCLCMVLPALLRQLVWALTPKPYKALYRFRVAGMAFARADDRMRRDRELRRRRREEQARQPLPLLP